MFMTEAMLPMGMACPVRVPESERVTGMRAYVADTGLENDDVLLTETRELSNSEKMLEKGVNQTFKSSSFE